MSGYGDYGFDTLDNGPERAQTAEAQAAGCGRRLARGCWRTLVLAVQLGVISVLLAFIGVVGSYAYLSNQLGDAIDRVVAYQGTGPGGTPRFFDRNGQLLFELKTTEKRRWLEYEEIPRAVISATVAVEDDTFWENPGFDAPAIAAAALARVRQEEGRPAGASTITQQLVRHIAFTYEERVAVSYQRKLREIFLAFILTQQRSKREIMTMYLNEIYYGNLAYGVEAAAQSYFGKRAAELTLGEAAFLAGLPQSPVELDPYRNFEGASARQRMVLQLMVNEGMITPLDMEVAHGAPLHMVPLIPVEVEVSGVTLEAPHFVIYVQQYLEQRYGPDALINGGWQVTTSLDLNIQRLAEQAVREQVAARAAAHDVNNGAAVVLKPATGEILAMVGSVDYYDESIDGQVNVTLQPRQPGSSIKPITYAAAMERGWTTADVIWDVPISLDLGNGEEFVPVNYSGRYHGPLLLRDALANSYNIPPIQLIRDIGISTMIATGRKMGVVSLDEPPGFYGLTLTLGGGDVPLLEMTHAFATLANMGRRPQLTSVLKIEDGRGNVVYDAQRDRTPAANALDPRIAYIISDILDDDSARAPAMGYYNALNLPFPAAAKTGTTNDFRDNWTLGYTPGVVTGVWLGNTDGHPMVDSSGLRGAAPVWRRIMEGIYADSALEQSLLVNGQPPPVDFPRPNGIEEREVCLPRGTGGSRCTAGRMDLFLSGGPQHGIPRLGYRPDVTSNPGAWTLSVLPLPADAAQRVHRPPLSNGYEPPPPTQCVVNSGRPPAGAQTRLYLPVPPYYPDEARARLWLQRYGGGFKMAPTTVCPAEVVRTARGESAGSAGAGDGFAPAPTTATYRIVSPAPGEEVSGLVQIAGTASFDPADVQYYKIEIGSGRAPSTWTTLGTTHSQPVVNGVLEELHADALPPGDYVLRLIVVRNDGNYPAPFRVPIRVTE
ncbi:MAG: transglycosylase domain-containing protein [Candidatus Promineifilaceae bacterium]|nr:transglycosylase domain-containing protein [Candidatus Promineifilaceae bacterium]